MAGNIIENRVKWTLTIPLQIAEIVGATQATADTGAAVQKRLHDGIMSRCHEDDAHNARTADNPHLRLHAVGFAFVDGDKVVSSEYAVGNDTGIYHFKVCDFVY